MWYRTVEKHMAFFCDHLRPSYIILVLTLEVNGCMSIFTLISYSVLGGGL